MRISHRYKFVFLAYPRTASTSVRAVLDPYSDVTSVNVTRTTPDNPFHHHITARKLKAIFDEREWHWPEFQRFCVIRNPYSRVVSLYNHHLRMRVGKYRQMRTSVRIKKWFKYKLEPPPTFREYVLSLGEHHGLALSFHDFAYDEAGQCLVTRVLRFETLSAELPVYLDDLGLGDTQSIPTLAASNIRDYREPYDEETKEIVGNRYRFEIERYGYDFDSL